MSRRCALPRNTSHALATPKSHWRGVYPAVALVSATALAYELLLMRLLSLLHWQHFAAMIISLALLGYGASGSFLTVSREWLAGRPGLALRVNAALFAIAMAAGYLFSGDIPFNGLELIWDCRQLGYLGALFVLLALPFFFAANCVGLALMWRREVLHRIYFVDLLGAGIGAVGVVGLLFVLPLGGCLRVLMVTAALAAVLGGWGQAAGSAYARWFGRGLPLLGVALIGLIPATVPLDKISQFKGLPQALAVSGARVVEQRSSPLGLLTVVDNPVIPLRHAPGMSLMSGVEPPAQLAVFTDGDGLDAITRFDGELAPLGYLDQLTSALPYHLAVRPRVLALGAGGGAPVLQALYHGAKSVDAVELNPQLVELVRRRYAGFAGAVYDRKEVQVHIAEARAFVARSDRHYDLIQVAALDAYGASGAGLYAQSESYVYTAEALRAYYRHLRPEGILAITRWLKLPPRDSLKLIATLDDALREEGIGSPATRVVLIRGWQTATLLAKRGPFTAAEIERVRGFCADRSFDLVWYPGIAPDEVNRYNRLDRPWLFLGASALLGAGRKTFLQDYKFDIRPARDNRPYFHQFFRWATLPELLGLGARGGLVLLDSGYLILIATLGVAALLSLMLILLPLARLRLTSAPGAWVRVVVYFLALGLGFLFIEMAFIQRLTLYLGHPLYAVALVLSAFLVFAGLGSGCSARLRGHRLPLALKPISAVVGGIVATGVVYLMLLGPLFELSLRLGDAWRVLVALAVIVPLAFLMGMPFPLGLAKLADEAPGLIPWAWGINGCASVLGALLAMVLAIHVGFTAVLGCAALCYLLAAASLRGPLV